VSFAVDGILAFSLLPLRWSLALGWPLEPTFLVPEEVREVFLRPARAGAETHRAWKESLKTWRGKHPDLSPLLDAHLTPELDARTWHRYQQMRTDYP
jgi:transketolase